MKKLRLNFLRQNTLAAIGGGLLLGIFSLSLRAASHTWAGVGLSGYWSLPANWAGNNPPSAGEAAPVTITFPAGAARLTNTNNVGGLVINRITFTGGGYGLYGLDAGTNITLPGGRNVTVVTNAPNVANVMAGSLNLTLPGSGIFDVGGGGSLTVNGITQGAGSVVKSGVGAMTFFGSYANTYSGATYVTAGTLKLFCGTFINPQLAVPGYLEIGGGSSMATVQLLGPSQLNSAATLQLDDYAVLDLNNNSAGCGPLVFNYTFIPNANPSVTTGSGTLTLNGDVSGSAGDVSGQLSLGGVTRHFNFSGGDLRVYAKVANGGAAAGIIKDGTGYVDLINSNSFSGSVTINAGALSLADAHSAGTGAGGVTVNSNGVLSLITDFMAVSNVTLTLDGHGSATGGRVSVAAAPAYWFGPVVLASDSTFENFFQSTSQFVVIGSISGPGGVRLIGGNVMNFGGSTDNTYTGTTWITSSNGLMLFKSGGAKAISGPLVVGTNIDPPYSAYLSLSAPNQIADNAPVTVNASGILMLNGFNETIGDFSGNGYASLGTGVFTVGGANATNVFSGIITSSAGGEFDKISTNILILTGSNPYTGNTLVKNGTLLVNGYQSGSACYISPGAILGGIGTVGDILDLGGTVSPGHNGPGQLNCGHATFSSGSTFQVELQGTNAGVNYDQLNATGVITINAGVNLSVTNSFGGAVSNQFVVLKNDLTDAIIGTFNGLTNGANFSANGNTFRLNYTGNTGNDLVLTQLSSGVNAPQFGSLARLGNGGIQFNAVGTANQTYTVQANTNLATATWQTLGLTTANNLGALTYTDLQATNFATRCYRLSYP